MAAQIHINPGQDRDDVEKILQATYLLKPDGDALRRKIESGDSFDRQRVLLLTIAYCAQALQEDQKGKGEVAWSLLFDAMYFAGFSLMFKFTDVAWTQTEREIAKEAFLHQKKLGGIAKNSGWKRVEDEAVRSITILGEKGETWKNERQMAESIYRELRIFMLVEVPNFSEGAYVDTISRRLKGRSADIGKYLKKQRG